MVVPFGSLNFSTLPMPGWNHCSVRSRCLRSLNGRLIAAKSEFGATSNDRPVHCAFDPSSSWTTSWPSLEARKARPRLALGEHQAVHLRVVVDGAHRDRGSRTWRDQFFVPGSWCFLLVERLEFSCRRLRRSRTCAAAARRRSGTGTPAPWSCGWRAGPSRALGSASVSLSLKVNVVAVDLDLAVALDDVQHGGGRAPRHGDGFARPQHDRREAQHRHALAPGLRIDVGELHQLALGRDLGERDQRLAHLLPRIAQQRIAGAARRRASDRAPGRRGGSATATNPARCGSTCGSPSTA